MRIFYSHVVFYLGAVSTKDSEQTLGLHMRVLKHHSQMFYVVMTTFFLCLHTLTDLCFNKNNIFGYDTRLATIYLQRVGLS